ncbi:MAG TPA: hypothetical protein VIU11_11430 [Nakamurella sp.]
MALHSVNGPDGAGSGSGVDVDAEAGFFEMSPAGAEQVTLQIRSMMERAWEYIAIAYQGRAHIALGYESWDQYVDARLGDLRLTVPREERGAVVQSLNVAGPAAMLVAKLIKLQERLEALRDRRPDRIKPKDVTDIFRLLVGTQADELNAGFSRHQRSVEAAQTRGTRVCPGRPAPS